MSSLVCRSLSVISAMSAPLAVGNFQTVMVAMCFSSDGIGRKRGPGSGIEDLALLQFELGLVEDAGVAQLRQFTQLSQLGVHVGATRLGRRSGVGGLRIALLRLGLR